MKATSPNSISKNCDCASQLRAGIKEESLPNLEVRIQVMEAKMAEKDCTAEKKKEYEIVKNQADSSGSCGCRSQLVWLLK